MGFGKKTHKKSKLLALSHPNSIHVYATHTHTHTHTLLINAPKATLS